MNAMSEEMKKEEQAEACGKPACEMKTSIGGQALLEGIMMRGPKKTAMAVRNLKGEIVVEEWDTVTKAPAKIWKFPIFRGLYGMYSSLKIGYKALMRSAMLSGLDELAEEEEREAKLKKLNKKRAKEGLPPLEYLPGFEPKEENAVDETVKEAVETVNEVSEAVSEAAESANIAETVSETAEEVKETVEKATEVSEKAEDAKKEEKKGGMDALIAGAAVVGTVLGVVLSIFLFVWLPTQLYSWTVKDSIDNNITSSYPNMLLRSLFEGLLRIVIFVLYMYLVSLMKDIKRTFMYHGAEHKTIFCYEKGLPLTVENVRTMRRFHPRCGTSFLIVMLIFGILIGSFIPRFTVGSEMVNNLLRSLCKIALLPITVGLGYEFIRYAGRHDNLLVKILSAPGLWMQRISTKEPDDSMIECAITAVTKVIPDDGSDRL